MEQQLTEFVNMIKSQVGTQGDGNLRKQNEELMQNFKMQNPDLYVQLCLAALKNNEDVHVRTYCVIGLKKNLSEFAEKSFNNLWEKITAETQQLFKTQIFVCLDSESSSNTRGLIADCIGEIGGNLQAPIDYQNKSNQWPELLNLVWQLFSCERQPIIQSGFRILSQVLIYSSEALENSRDQVKLLCQNGLANNDIDTKVGALECLASFITTIEPKELHKYEDMLTPCLEATLAVMGQDEDQGERCLEVIADIAEEEPKFLKKNFSLVFNTLHRIFNEKKIESASVKRISIEILVLVIERFPSTIKSNDLVKKQLIEMIFMYMIDMDSDIDEEWLKPKEGFRECFSEDGDNANTHFGMGSIDRLMESVGQDKLMATLSEILQQMLQNQDWRYPFSALMALSQVGEYLEDISDIATIIPVILSFVSHQSPKVRYAACHTIGQISNDMKPQFQQKFAPQVFPVMVKAFDDAVPRVQAHSLASMTNFMEGCDHEMVAPYLEQALQKSFILLENGISLIKENSLSNIAALAEAAGEHFTKYYKECLPLIFKVYQQFPQKEYKQLRGVVVEAITIIGDAIPKEEFLPYLSDTVQLILKIQDSDLDQVDPQKNFVLTGWSRICQKYNKEFVQFLPAVIPSVTKVIQQIMKNSDEQDDAETDPEEQGQHTYEHKEAESAMTMLDLFVDKLGSDLGPYIQQFTEIIMPLCNFSANEDVRCQASRCLPGLIKCVVGQNRELAVNLTKEFLGILLQAAEKEYDAETITAQIQGMKGCIEAVGLFLTQEQLNQLSQKIIELLIQSDKRKTGNEKLAGEEGTEDEEKALYEMDTTAEEDLHVSIAELLGVLFQTHADLSGELSELMYSKFLPSVLSESVSTRMHQFGVFLIDDMIEFLKFQRISNKWPHLAEALVKYATSKDCKVRQATVYGIGVFAQETPESEFGKYVQPLLEACGKALEIPQQSNQTLKTYTHCKDNTIAALGKILKAQWNQVQQKNQVVDFWLSQLPLKKDKEEAFVQHEFLCDLVIDQAASAVLFQNQQNYTHVVQLFGKIVDSKTCNAQIKEKIKQGLKVLGNVEAVRNNWGTIISALNEDQRQNLENCAK